MPSEELRVTLYKYCVPARIDALQAARMRFTQPAALNDPFELRPFFDSLAPTGEVERQIVPSWEQLEEELRRQYYALPAAQRALVSADQFTAIVKANPQFVERALAQLKPLVLAAVESFMPELRRMLGDGFAERVGILSLSETADDVLMWAHYADNHRGMVLVFDRSSPFFDRRRSPRDDFFHLRQVQYTDKLPSGKAMTELTALDVFLSKHSRWTSEREWRMLVPLTQPDQVLEADGDRIYLYNFPPSALTGVILGARAHPSLIEEVRALAKSDSRYEHLSLAKATLNESTRQVEIASLE
jgi:hypothetical protein